MMRQHAAYQERSNQTMHLSGPRGNVLDLGALNEQYQQRISEQDGEELSLIHI